MTTLWTNFSPLSPWLLRLLSQISDHWEFFPPSLPSLVDSACLYLYPFGWVICSSASMVESQPPLSPVPGQTSPNLQVDSALLTDRFKPSLKSDYAGCGYFDPFEHTIGKQADETDKAFYYWKKCVQYASYVGGTTHSRTINKSCRSSIHIYRESTVKKMLVQIRVLLNYWLERIQILIFLATNLLVTKVC